MFSSRIHPLKIVAWFLGAFLVQGTLFSAPKVLWHRAYNGSGEESHPHYVIETRDGGFLMVGETGFVEDRTARIFLVKTDSKGRLKWKRELGRRGYNPVSYTNLTLPTICSV